MPLSYRNLINSNKVINILGENDGKFLKEQTVNPKYVKGYERENFWEDLFGDSLNDDEKQSRFGQLFGLNDKKLDPYDPYTTDTKKEEFWENIDGKKPSGRILFPEIDEDVNRFRNVLFSDHAYPFKNKIGNGDQFEDPLKLGFEIDFDIDSPFFNGDENDEFIGNNPPYNTMRRFFYKYIDIEDITYRYYWYLEFKKKLFTIFEKNLNKGNKNIFNKPYYIKKISGLNKLNQKLIKYGEDKLTITLNEDVRMISWYISELYNNLIYSYKNKRMMIPENLLKFNMNIKIHDYRNFIMPEFKEYIREDSNYQGEIINKISPKSKIVFTLHDCNFLFQNSYNFNDEITISDYNGISIPNSELSFDIIYKSVTKWSDFPFLNETIDPWEKSGNNFKSDYYKQLEILKNIKPTNIESKGFWNNKLQTAYQSVANAGLNYLDNLETKLREERGKFVEKTLQQFREKTTINKIEPDNVYNKDFNNRISLKNAGRQLASDLLNDFEGGVRNTANF